VVRQPITVKPGATEVVFDVALPEDYKVMPDSQPVSCLLPMMVTAGVW
jgi:hypothetical protein